MRKIIGKVVAIGLVATMILSLAACGNNEATEDVDNAVVRMTRTKMMTSRPKIRESLFRVLAISILPGLRLIKARTSRYLTCLP